MFLNSIDRKPLFKKSDGNVVRDLTQSIFDFKANNYTSFNMFKISSDYLLRPDLISQAVYNNSLYAEYILKYNGISNPFSMDIGDIILVPDLDSAQKNTNVIEGTNLDAPSNRLRDSYKYIDPAKIPKKQNDFDNRILDGSLPPNIANKGTSQIVERNGRIYFGETIGESACLKSGMSSGEFLTKVIKSRKI